MNIDIVRAHPSARMPIYGTEGAACFDLFGIASTATHHQQGHRVLVAVDTGLKFAVPHGFMLKLFPRSGLKLKYGLTVFAGVIDSDFRGTVRLLLDCPDWNAVPTNVFDNPVAQASIIQSVPVRFNEVCYLPDTARGEGGFGSTG